jgi:HK97 family phage major capsid protein
MSVILDSMNEHREALIDQATAIAQQGVTESRALTAEESEKFDKLYAEVAALDTRRQAVADGEQRAADIEASFRKSGVNPGQRGGQDEGTESEFAQWVRAAKFGDGYNVASVRGAERRALLANRRTNVREEEARAMAADGGIGKDGVYGRLWEYAVESSEILQAGVDVISTTHGNAIPMPRATLHAETDDAVVAANSAIQESDSTLGTVDLPSSKYGFLTRVPSELVADATFDIEAYISRNAGRQLGLRIAQVASTAAQAGFTTAGVTGPAVDTATSLGSQSEAGQGSDLLIDLFHSVISPYRTAASWLMADPTAAMVRKLKTADGEMVWERALTAGDPGMIEGRNVYIDPYLPTPAADAKSIFFGDWSALKVRIAGGLRFERSAEFAFDTDQVTFRAIVRTGAVALDPNAVKFFAHGAAA